MSQHPTQSAPEVAIEVGGLISRYGKTQVLHGIDLQVQRGEIMAIMGGSGSGKTTLLRHLLGLKDPAEGQVKVLGCDLAQTRGRQMDALRRKTGVAFQFGALFSSLTVGENVMLPLREHTKLDQQTMDIMVRLKLEIVDLPDAENLLPSELSGGMVKRAAMARAIIMDPEVLFLDEPSAGLDPVVAASLDDLILSLRDATGMTIVVVTHELDSAFKIADRITVLDKGEILISDDTAAVRASDNERVQNLLNRRTEADQLDAQRYLDRLTGRPLAGKY